MLRLIVGSALVLSASVARAETIPPDNPELLPKLIAKSEGLYSKLADNVWQVTYNGKNLRPLNVRIAAAAGGVFFIVDIVPRQGLPLSKNVLVKLAELNSEYDYVKLVLGKEALSLRLDARLAALDQKEFQFLENQAATAADEIYAVMRDFLP